MACAAPGYGDPFLSGMLNYIDCQALSIGGVGYQALSAPGSVASSIFAALLVVFIAVIGLRMLAGQTPGTGDLFSATIKVGIALALAGSWLAYRTVIYDPVLRGPAEVASSVGSPAGLPGSGSDFVARLQGVDDMIVAFTTAGTGRLDRALPAQSTGTAAPVVQRIPLADDIAFAVARLAFLVGALGTLGFARLVSGLLLAIAPLVAGLLLFRGTSGVFFGWLRMLVAMALTAYLVSVILMIELAIAEPWLAGALSLRASYYATPAAPIELLALTLTFALILLLVVGVGLRIAFGGWLPVLVQFARSVQEGRYRPTAAAPQSQPRLLPSPPGAVENRVGRIADGLVAGQQREALLQTRQPVSASMSSSSRVPEGPSARTDLGAPLGQRFRKTASRVVAPNVRGVRL